MRITTQIQNNYYSESSMVSAIRKQEAGNVKEIFTKQLYSNEVDKAQETKVMTPEEEMEVFKKEFYAELERIPKNRTIVNLAINISEKAFENMKADPEYRAKIMSALQRDLTSSFAPLKASLLLTVGATEKDYRGDSWSGPNNESEFFARSQNSFYKTSSEKSSESKKSKQKQLMEEFLAKRQAEKRFQKEMLEEKAEKEERTQEYFKRQDVERAYNNQVIIQKDR